MIKKVFFLFIASFLLAEDASMLLKNYSKLYKEGKYEKICHNGYRYFHQFRNNSNLISIYAFSCLYSDYIDRLATPILALNKTPQDRKNRSYFSIILAQKNLLYSAVVDNIAISGVEFPSTDYIISKVAYLFFHRQYSKKNGRYILKDPNNPAIHYEMYSEPSRYKRPLLVIEEHKNGTITIHKYL